MSVGIVASFVVGSWFGFAAAAILAAGKDEPYEEDRPSVTKCQECSYMGDGSYCNLWHKHGLGGNHFCSYASKKVER